MTATEQLMEMLSNKGGSQASASDFVGARIKSQEYTLSNNQPYYDVEHLVNRADLNTTHKVILDLASYDLLQTKVAPEVMGFISSPKRLLGKVIWGDHDDKFSKLVAAMIRARR